MKTVVNNNWEKIQKPILLPGQRICPTCKGTGINPVFIINVCPKCNGETVVERYGRYGVNTNE